jgi:hypothetical protein
MAVEVNISSPAFGATANPDGSGNLVVQGSCRSPGGQPTVAVWIRNGNNKQMIQASTVVVTAVTNAPGYYQWTATFNTPANFNISTDYHTVKGILTTILPASGSIDFITRIAEIFIQASGF